MPFTRHVSRSTGQPYLHDPATGETRWPQPTVVSRAYDALAECPPDTDPASRARRLAHNRWKRDLLTDVFRAGDRVLDVACGRGGDVRKFPGCAAYVGVDVSPACVAEARRRAAGLPEPAVATFHTCDATVEALPCGDGWVDVVSCQFALHYFAGSRADMDTVAGEIARVLKPGGRFVATFPDFERVFTAPRPTHMVVVGDPATSADLSRRPWGRGYEFEYVGRTPRLTEYLVYPPALESVLASHGLDVERYVDPPPDAAPMYTAVVARRR